LQFLQVACSEGLPTSSETEGQSWRRSGWNAGFTEHDVDFERAAEVFRDPLALTIPDEAHSISEAR
jgi:hypothetical protein